MRTWARIAAPVLATGGWVVVADGHNAGVLIAAYVCGCLGTLGSAIAWLPSEQAQVEG